MRAGIGKAVCLAALIALAEGSARADGVASPPAPELPLPRGAIPEAGVDALAAGDPRRPQLLLDLALVRHHEAEALEREELRARAEALERWRASSRAAAGSSSPPPPVATPRADAQRAEAIRLAQRALDERLGSAGASQALLVVGVDAERIGRRKDAAKALGALVRGFPGSPQAAEAWLALGEHHLADRDLTKARAAFESAARSGSAGVAAWSAARLAEVALAASDPEGGLDALARALAAGSARAIEVLDRLASAPDALALEGSALVRLADLCDRSGDPGRALALRARLARESARVGLDSPRRKGSPRQPPRPPAGEPPPAAPGPVLRASAPPPAAGRRPELRLAAFAGDGQAAHALGLAALAAGRAAEAKALFRRALAEGVAGEQVAAVENDLGVSLSALGDLAGARVALASALEQDPDLAAARENARALAPPPEAAPQP